MPWSLSQVTILIKISDFLYYLISFFITEEWIVSDDTIFHLANMECLIENKGHELGKDVYNNLIKHYQNAMKDMDCKDILIFLILVFLIII